MIFSRKTKIRFKHCDMAGIVFYPRYFEILNDFIEDWFEELDYSFSNIHDEKIDAGLPMVNIVCDFKKPSYVGESLDKELYLSKIGNTSCNLKVCFKNEETKEIKLEMSLTIVHIALKAKKPKPWNADMKSKMQKYLQ